MDDTRFVGGRGPEGLKFLSELPLYRCGLGLACFRFGFPFLIVRTLVKPPKRVTAYLAQNVFYTSLYYDEATLQKKSY